MLSGAQPGLEISCWDNARALDVLEQFGAPAFGAMGWSGGRTQAYILAAADERVSAAACFFSFMTLRHQFYQHRCCHCLYHFIPGMVAEGIDWDQVVATTEPRKLFFGWGGKDAEVTGSLSSQSSGRIRARSSPAGP